MLVLLALLRAAVLRFDFCLLTLVIGRPRNSLLLVPAAAFLKILLPVNHCWGHILKGGALSFVESTPGHARLTHKAVRRRRSRKIVLGDELRFERLRVHQAGLHLRRNSRVPLRRVGYH